jgi:hypothetical protein
MFETFIKYVLGEFRMIWDAPLSFVAAVLGTALIAWIALDWRYSTIIANKDSEITLAKSQRDDYRDKLGGATAEQAKAAIDAIKKQGKMNDPDKPLIAVTKKLFHNERVPLDGYRYSDCKFENVTFVYNGGPAEFSHNHVVGYSIASDSLEINAVMKMMFEMGVINGPALMDGAVINPSNTISR